MSDTSAATRPRQVTIAAWVGGGSSVGLLVTAGDLITKLKTVDLRQAVADFLLRQGDSVVRISVDEALTIARIGLLVCGAAAAASVVMAFFVARRDRSARVGMSVMAVPLLVCGIFVDPFLAGFAVMSAVLLWTAPARDWYAGRAPRVAAQKPAAPAAPAAAPPTAAAPAATPDAGWPAPQPYAAYGAPQPAAPPAGPSPDRRPGRLVAACLITWLVSSVVVLLMGVVAFTLNNQAARDEMRRLIADNAQVRDAGYTVDELVVFVGVFVALIAVWAVIAIVVAVFAYRGQGWARVVLAVSAALAGLGSLGATLANPGFLLVAMACAITLVLLFHRDTTAWYAARSRQPAGPPRPRVQPPDQPW